MEFTHGRAVVAYFHVTPCLCAHAMFLGRRALAVCNHLSWGVRVRSGGVRPRRASGPGTRGDFAGRCAWAHREPWPGVIQACLCPPGRSPTGSTNLRFPRLPHATSVTRGRGQADCTAGSSPT